MMNLDQPAMILIAVAALVVGWLLHKWFAAKAPSEKTLALKVGIAAMERLSKMQSATPAQLASAAAAQAHEAALLQAFKDAAAKLS